MNPWSVLSPYLAHEATDICGEKHLLHPYLLALDLPRTCAWQGSILLSWPQTYTAKWSSMDRNLGWLKLKCTCVLFEGDIFDRAIARPTDNLGYICEQLTSPPACPLLTERNLLKQGVGVVQSPSFKIKLISSQSQEKFPLPWQTVPTYHMPSPFLWVLSMTLFTGSLFCYLL